eukprot:scaffold5128_cov104-Isochrysis_galbana.AAC.5
MAVGCVWGGLAQEGGPAVSRARGSRRPHGATSQIRARGYALQGACGPQGVWGPQGGVWAAGARRPYRQLPNNTDDAEAGVEEAVASIRVAARLHGEPSQHVGFDHEGCGRGSKLRGQVRGAHAVGDSLEPVRADTVDAEPGERLVGQLLRPFHRSRRVDVPEGGGAGERGTASRLSSGEQAGATGCGRRGRDAGENRRAAALP